MNKMIFAAAALALAGCASTPASPIQDRNLIAQTERDIRAALREPSAGQFKDPRAYQLDNGEKSVCFSVNTTNAFGGYTGFQPMIVIYTRAGGNVIFEGGPAVAECNGLKTGNSMRP